MTAPPETWDEYLVRRAIVAGLRAFHDHMRLAGVARMPALLAFRLR